MPTTYAIPNGRTVMDATLYTGNGNPNNNTQTIVNSDNGTVGFKPDFVWIKSRSSAYNNSLFDSVRGVNNVLCSNSTAAADATPTDALNSFNSNGFTVGANNTGSLPSTNVNGATYVAWQWQAGQGTTSSNTSGTITSTVSVNATAGFSIVSYTGNGINGATVGHGLGVKPKLIIEKGRSTTYNWIVQGCGELWTPDTSSLFLNSTSGLNASSSYSQPNSTTFYPSLTNYANENGVANIAYVWAEVAGFSKFGSYTGNGSSDGPFIYTGFRPKFFIWKQTNSTASWGMYDSTRSPYNVTSTGLWPNLADAEADFGSNYYLDFLSNGIKIRGSGTGFNGSSETIIYMAFAENPFKYANAR